MAKRTGLLEGDLLGVGAPLIGPAPWAGPAIRLIHASPHPIKMRLPQVGKALDRTRHSAAEKFTAEMKMSKYLWCAFTPKKCFWNTATLIY